MYCTPSPNRQPCSSVYWAFCAKRNDMLLTLLLRAGLDHLFVYFFLFFFVGLVAVGREWTFPTHWRNNKHGARTQGWMIFCVFQPLSQYSADASSFPLGGEALKATGRNYIGIYYCRPKNSSGRFQFWPSLIWVCHLNNLVLTDCGYYNGKGVCIYLFLLAWLKIANENNSVKDMWLLDINKQWNFENNNKNMLSCFFN